MLGLTLTTVAAEVPSFEKAKPNNWHHWRGPDANGVSTTAKPPLEWSPTNNIQWKTPIEGNGSSTPIIWGNKLFILTAINTGEVNPTLPRPEDQPKRVFGITHPNTSYEFVVLCLDRHTGKVLWRQTCNQTDSRTKARTVTTTSLPPRPPPMASGSIAGSVPPVCFATISTAKNFGIANSAKCKWVRTSAKAARP